MYCRGEWNGDRSNQPDAHDDESPVAILSIANLTGTHNWAEKALGSRCWDEGKSLLAFHKRSYTPDNYSCHGPFNKNTLTVDQLHAKVEYFWAHPSGLLRSTATGSHNQFVYSWRSRNVRNGLQDHLEFIRTVSLSARKVHEIQAQTWKIIIYCKVKSCGTKQAIFCLRFGQ